MLDNNIYFVLFQDHKGTTKNYHMMHLLLMWIVLSGHCFIYPLYLLWVWTKLFSGIVQDWRKQAETFRLSSKFLKILWLNLPSSAEQVQALSTISDHVKVRHQTVFARWLQDGEGVIKVVKADAGTSQCDVGADLLTGLTEAKMTVNGKTISIICEDDVGRVPPFEPLLVRPTVHAARSQDPFAQQEMDIQPIQWPQQVLARHRGWLAHHQGEEKKNGTQEKHVSVWNDSRTHSNVANCCCSTAKTRLVL